MLLSQKLKLKSQKLSSALNDYRRDNF